MPNKVEKKLPLGDFVGKIDVEGGVYDAFFEYGLNPDQYDLPEGDAEKIKALVAQIKAPFAELMKIYWRLNDLDIDQIEAAEAENE